MKSIWIHWFILGISVWILKSMILATAVMGIHWLIHGLKSGPPNHHPQPVTKTTPILGLASHGHGCSRCRVPRFPTGSPQVPHKFPTGSPVGSPGPRANDADLFHARREQHAETGKPQGLRLAGRQVSRGAWGLVLGGWQTGWVETFVGSTHGISWAHLALSATFAVADRFLFSSQQSIGWHVVPKLLGCIQP